MSSPPAGGGGDVLIPLYIISMDFTFIIKSLNSGLTQHMSFFNEFLIIKKLPFTSFVMLVG